MKSLLQPPPFGPPQREESGAAEHRVFWRNFVLIAFGHLVIVLALFLSGMLRPKPKPVEVLWLDGGAMGGGENAAPAAAEPEIETPIAEPDPPMDEIEEPMPEFEEPIPQPTPPPVEKPVESEIVEPKATPIPAIPKPATPKPATPKPATPKPATPKPTTPKPATPKPATPKPATPKASPKATPKASASPKPATSPKPAAASTDKGKATPSPDKKTAGNSGEKNAAKNAKVGGAGGGADKSAGTGKGSGTGKTGSGSGTGISQFGWYTEMIHDRYYSRWEQPVGIGEDVLTTVRLRIMKDGTIAKHDMVKSSGNPQMDESVMSAVEKVTQIDPLPAGLGNGEYFDLNVAFKVGG